MQTWHSVGQIPNVTDVSIPISKICNTNTNSPKSSGDTYSMINQAGWTILNEVYKAKMKINTFKLGTKACKNNWGYLIYGK